jgi:hypothetical protein
MRLLLFPCGSLCLAGLAPPAGADDRYTILFPGQGNLGVVAGKVRAVFGSLEDYDWELIGGEGETTIKVLAPKKWRGCYLAYDPKGKDPAVFLTGKRGPGTKWRLTWVKGEGSGVHTLQAAAGKYKGWYLDVGAEGEKFVTEKAEKGKTATARRVFLSRKPRRLPKAIFTEIAP